MMRMIEKKLGLLNGITVGFLKNMISLTCFSHSFTLYVLFTSSSPAVLQEKHPFKTTWFSSERLLWEELEICAPKSVPVAGNKEVNETKTSLQASPAGRSAVKQACQRLSPRAAIADIQAEKRRQKQEEEKGKKTREATHCFSLT